MSDQVTETQVLIIGGGITGTALARELSKYKVDVCLVEKEPAAGFGITKRSQGAVHGWGALFVSRLVKWFDRSVDVAGYIKEPLHLKEKLNIAGRPKFLELAPFLKAKIHKCGILHFAWDKAEMRALEIIKEVTEGYGFKDMALLDRNQIRDLEPGVDLSKRIGAIYDPEEYTIVPAQWAMAFADNAKQNGAHLVFNTEVRGIEDKKEYYLVKTNNGPIKAEWVINVSGMFSEKIAAMVGKIDWSFILWEHQYLVLENNGYLKTFVFEMPRPFEPRLMIPTPEGKILAGGHMFQHSDKERYDNSNTRKGLNHVAEIAQSYIPSVPWHKNVVRSFRGYLHFNSQNPDDCLIDWQRERFLNLIVCPPSLAATTAYADEAVKMLGKKGLDLVEKSDFNPYRDQASELRFIELPTDEKNAKVQAEPGYGHIICRCEKACEQEVREAVRNGATTLDEIKFRTMAGMGKCQGGFCTSRVIKIVSEELGISPLGIKQKGGNSYVLDHETKQLTKRR